MAAGSRSEPGVSGLIIPSTTTSVTTKIVSTFEQSFVVGPTHQAANNSKRAGVAKEPERYKTEWNHNHATHNLELQDTPAWYQ